MKIGAVGEHCSIAESDLRDDLLRAIRGNGAFRHFGAAFAGGGATQAGKYLVTSLLKFVPGANVAAMAIRGTVASSLTYAVGEAWIAVCLHLYKVGPAAAENIPADEIRGLFMAEFKKQATRKRSV